MNKISSGKFIRSISFGLVIALAAIPGIVRADGDIVYLPKIARRIPPPVGYIPANPGFEAGDSGWVSLYDNGNPIRTNTLAHSGSWSAEIGAYYNPADPEPVAYTGRGGRLQIENTSDSSLPMDYYIGDIAFVAKP